MLASRVRQLAAAVLLGAVAAGSFGACGGAKFTLADDAGAGDASAGGDAAPQDASTADGGDVGFCPTHQGHLLCDDFDRPSSDPKGVMLWDTFSTSAATDGVLNAGGFVSPPRSFLASTTRPGLNGTTLEETFLTKDVGHAKSVLLQFDVMAEAYGGGGTNPAYLVHVQFGQLGYSLVAYSATSLVFEETITAIDGGSGMTTPHPTGTGLPTAMWTHIGVTLNLPQGAIQGSVAITLNNQATAQTPLTYTTATALPNGAVSFGLLVTTAPTIWKIRYDNVLIDKVN